VVPTLKNRSTLTAGKLANSAVEEFVSKPDLVDMKEIDAIY
jgi:hypothetical protein